MYINKPTNIYIYKYIIIVITIKVCKFVNISKANKKLKYDRGKRKI